jgi:hypothetical protein
MLHKLIITLIVLALAGGGTVVAKKIYDEDKGEKTIATTSPDTTLPNGEKPLPPDDATTVTLRIGETGTRYGIAVTPIGKIEDSRCPTDVTCIWAGMVSVNTSIRSDMGESIQPIALGGEITTEAHAVTLVGVTPYPRSIDAITPSEYRFTYSIKERVASY